MRMSARMQENTLREEWRSLTAVIGKPDLQLATVAGDLQHDWPELNEEEAVEAIVKNSPAIGIADTNTLRALAVLARARKESVPIFRFVPASNTIMKRWAACPSQKDGKALRRSVSNCRSSTAIKATLPLRKLTSNAASRKNAASH